MSGKTEVTQAIIELEGYVRGLPRERALHYNKDATWYGRTRCPTQALHKRLLGERMAKTGKAQTFNDIIVDLISQTENLIRKIK